MPTSTTHIEYFTFDGPVHVVAAVAIASGLFGLFWWSLRRECEVIGKRNAVLFGLLRTVAMLVALWMLLAPARITSEKSRTRKSVAVVVDVSPSMLTVDPPATADDVRWAAAVQGAETGNPTMLADRALAAVTMAEHQLAEATRSLRQQSSERAALEAASAAHAALDRTRANTQRLADVLAASGSTDRTSQREQVGRVLQILDSASFGQLAKLADGFRRGYDSFPSGWRESLSDLEHQVAGIRRRLADVTQQVLSDSDLAVQQVDSAALRAARQSQRLARVTDFVASLGPTTWAPLSEQADIRHASFDRSFRPLENLQQAENAWRSAITSTDNSTSPSSAPSNVAAEPDHPLTDLTAALERLRQLKQDQPLAAVFLFTDAAHNRPEGRDPRVAAADLAGSPVYVVPIGNVNHVRDVELKAVSAPGVVMKDDEVVIEATVQLFDCASESVRVELLQDGEPIQDRSLTADSPYSTQRVRFNTRLPEVGLQRFQVRVSPLAGELSDENNFDQFEINVTRDHISVLLADELPRWEFRYLAQLFRRDNKVACDELLFHPRMLATGRRAESKGFPITTDEWDQYDVVLLGDISSENLPVASQQSLAAFVRERGGTLVIIAGQESMPQGYVQQPLEELLPVSKVEVADDADAKAGYAFQVTEDGWQHHALMIADTQDATRIAWDFVNRNAPLYSLSAYRRARSTARTLIAAVPRSAPDGEVNPQEQALLCWQPVGRGRVVYLASPETYRLRFLRGDRLHYRFWGQLLRWAIASDLAAGTQLVSVRTDRPGYRAGEKVEVVVRLADESGVPVAGGVVEAVAINGDGERTAIPLQSDSTEPGRYFGSFDQLGTGIYRVEPAGPDVERLAAVSAAANQGTMGTVSASFTVRAPRNRELLDTRSDRALAQQIADATGGQVLPPTAVSEVLALTNLEPIITEKTEVSPLWVQWKFLWVVFGCLFTEWVIRKQMGLS